MVLWHFLSKINLQALWIEVFLSKNYITLPKKISQYDSPINIFSNKHKYMYKEQSLCKLLSQNVINMSLLKALVLSVVLVYFRWHESVSKCHTCTKKVRRRIKPVFRKWRSGEWRPIGGSRDLGWVSWPHLEVPDPWVFLLFKRHILMLALFYFSKIDPWPTGLWGRFSSNFAWHLF